MAVAEALVPRIELPDGSIYGETGAIAFIAPTIDPATGTVAMHADFANPAERLLPGQFVTVLVQIGEPEQQIVVPQRAVLEDRQGRFVFIVDEQDRAQRQRIVAERRVDGQWVVSEGLTGGERIVVEGLQSVRPGQPVRPQTEDGQDDQSGGDQQGDQQDDQQGGG
jgi:membrane fusion protein (multidrug efflux system)